MSVAEQLTTIAENEQKVYDAGKKAEYDKFWDAFQWNGERTAYDSYCFALGSFNFDNFYPKYDIRIVGSSVYTFYNWRKNTNANIVGSLKQRLDECGVVLDTSEATNLANCFNYCRFTELPTIDLTATTTAAQTVGVFANQSANLKRIEKIIVNENTQFNGWFTNDTALEDVTFEGTIGSGTWNFQWCPLNVASMKSIISCLKPNCGGTLTFKEECWTALEADSTAPAGGTWREYVTNTLGWVA